ncbi:DUF4846 domain-containing protein [Mucilaginibacter myungsuensis]|uniref:DUF4846 domain-containing protein n=1 Tax=Mucilaginibacter myungsuensis TaxID=649104 RepID=A0A929PVG8_9SPHI|nr:DUF4846 domain-containing protein [Mucilaginibacter myungsuensis]MBE9660996.1 DUF4846 domain-containing protein [Mucilaginibacter myungsuensis]MDN3601042.1 DUF4846 domain-containing protein [Mucilaginibacter myungsuensis]
MKCALVLLFFVASSFVKPADRVKDRVIIPDGYHLASPDSFGQWLGDLPLKPVGTPTRNYRGEIARTDAYTAGVIDMSLGKRDLQQCADAVMRLRAEYLYQQKKYNTIAFNFTSGFKCDYLHYANGYRYANGKWVLKSGKDHSYKTFLNYMDLVFSYAGTLSLEKELVKVNTAAELKAGDVFIKGGSPGHCFMVMAIAENSTHEKKFLLAQSFMPAQDIQLLKNANGNAWFDLSSPANIPYGELVNLKFLKRFN